MEVRGALVGEVLIEERQIRNRWVSNLCAGRRRTKTFYGEGRDGASNSNVVKCLRFGRGVFRGVGGGGVMFFFHVSNVQNNIAVGVCCFYAFLVQKTFEI